MLRQPTPLGTLGQAGVFAALKVFAHSPSQKTTSALTASLYLLRGSPAAGEDDEGFEAFLTADEAQKTVLGRVQVIM